MSLANIWQWISTGFGTALNWLIHADLLIGLRVLGEWALIGIALALLVSLRGKYNRTLAKAHERFPDFMRRLYWSSLISAVICTTFFAIELALSFTEADISSTMFGASFLFGLLAWLAAILLRKPDGNT